MLWKMPHVFMKLNEYNVINAATLVSFIIDHIQHEIFSSAVDDHMVVEKSAEALENLHGFTLP